MLDVSISSKKIQSVHMPQRRLTLTSINNRIKSLLN